MQRRGLAVVALALLLVASPAVGGGSLAAGGAAAGGAGDGPGGPATAAAGDGGPSRVARGVPTRTAEPNLTIVIQLRPDGDARWTVSTYVSLDGENETKAFKAEARRWRAGTADVGYDADTFRRFVRTASEATGRRMAIPPDSVNRTAEIVANGSRGVFRLSFVWTNFARREGDRLIVDDVFQSKSGTWLPGLQAGQKLVIQPPPEFKLENAPPGARVENGNLIWRGPMDFPASYFMSDPVVFVADRVTPSATPPPTTRPPKSPSVSPTSTRTASPTPTPQDRQRGLLFGVVAALLLGGGLALYRLYGGPGLPGGRPAGASADDPGNEQSAPADGPDAASTEDGGDEDEDEPTPSDPFAGVDEELLADEERVLRLLEANGGRMKQADIVTETGWSNAKVSQLLSSMAEDGDIDKLRIGRENLISLPEVEVGEVD